jgi:tetratricopeptide (TPR) repeat protein
MPTQRKFISRFSPNRTDPGDLENINVQREDLLARSVAVLRDSALTKNKHHLLFIGPRGSGKTHLLCLIYHRLECDEDLNGRLLTAWLNEDETSTSFLDLLLRIYRALAERYPAEFHAAELERLRDRSSAEALDLLGRDLLSRIGGRTVLVLVENLDTLFRQLDESDQRAWRAFIQNHAVFATVATAQSLFGGVSERDQAFFGFFDTTHLPPLTAEEATELLRRIAKLNGDDALTQFLATHRGHARVQAIYHLSGGNPRLYIALSDFITCSSLDDLVAPFEETVDDQLTPYYQERLRWLSPQQRKIVELLCSRTRPLPVKEISAALFADPGSVGGQLQKLREMGYVKANPRGRESLYELAEPLMRLSMEVKNTRDHQPLRLIVDFLRVWFERGELEQLAIHYDKTSIAFKYLSAALEKLQPGQPNLRRELLLQSVESLDVAHCNLEDADKLRLLAEDNNEPRDWMQCGLAYLQLKEFSKALEAFEKAAKIPGKTAEQLAWALLNRGSCFGFLGKKQEAISDFTRVIDLSGAPVEPFAMALLNRGISHGVSRQTEQAIADYNRVIKLQGAPPQAVAQALVNRGIGLGVLGRTAEALVDFTRAIELPGAPVEMVTWALVNRGIGLGVLGRTEEELTDYKKVIEFPGAPVEPLAMALVNRGFRLALVGQSEEAIADCTRVIEMPGVPAEQLAKALVHRGIRFGAKRRFEQANADFTRVIDLPGVSADTVSRGLVNRAFGLTALGRSREGIADYSRVIHMPDAPVESITLALLNRALMLGQQGETQAAINDFSQVIDQPNAGADSIAQALYNRGVALTQVGRLQDAIADYSQATEVPAASAASLARALFLRALAFGKTGRDQAAIADLTKVIELPGAPPEQVARALVSRGMTLTQLGRAQEANADMLRAIAMPGTPADVISFACGWLVSLMLMLGEWNAAMERLEEFLGNPEKARAVVARVSEGVVYAIFSQIGSPNVWQARVVQALALYKKYGLLDYLGGALVQHLGRLKESPLGPAGFDQWVSGWEGPASSEPAMQFPLRLLRAGIAYLKTQPRDEGVLLQLPSEERSLVRAALGLAEELHA